MPRIAYWNLFGNWFCFIHFMILNCNITFYSTFNTKSRFDIIKKQQQINKPSAVTQSTTDQSIVSSSGLHLSLSSRFSSRTSKAQAALQLSFSCLAGCMEILNRCRNHFWLFYPFLACWMCAGRCCRTDW